MPLVPLTLGQLGPQLRAASAAACSSRKVLSLGYPDVLASPLQLREIFGAEIAGRLAYRDDSAAILRWHGAGAVTDRVADAASLFAALGYELEVLDIAAARGGEILQDLNQPVPERLKQRYALVLDSGTLEHCFNIAQGARNLAEMTALGGAVVHGNPLNMYNHGFYNLNPTWYHDFYGANGFEVESAQIVLDAVHAAKTAPAPPYARFAGIPDNATLLVVARRKTLCPIRWPVQRKYRDNPDLRG
jgi:hypothetical protein